MVVVEPIVWFVSPPVEGDLCTRSISCVDEPGEPWYRYWVRDKIFAAWFVLPPLLIRIFDSQVAGKSLEECLIRRLKLDMRPLLAISH